MKETGVYQLRLPSLEVSTSYLLYSIITHCIDYFNSYKTTTHTVPNSIHYRKLSTVVTFLPSGVPNVQLIVQVSYILLN